mgnify:CR=1 FL=1
MTQYCCNILSKEVKNDLSGINDKNMERNKSHKSRKSRKSNAKSMDRVTRKSAKTVNILTVKNKFILRNDFDRKHSKQFLEEKYEMLEKPILFDEICK